MTFSHQVYGQTQESIEKEWEQACRSYRNPSIHILGILSDVQHLLAGVRDTTGRLEVARQHLNKAKYLIDDKLSVKNLTKVVD